jgi:hypothetical protein
MLLWLLVVPILIGLGGLILGKGKVTWKELLVHEAVVIVIIGAGYAIGIWGSTSDTEIWNGVIAKKWKGSGSCCHSYPCNPHPCNCDSKGNCSTCWDTCYEHISDVTWNAITSNDETAYYDGCNRPGSSPPARWNSIVIGEPTAVEHSFTNYIKANPDTVLKRQGAKERFAAKIPAYPRVYDHYRADRFLAIGVQVPDRQRLSARLSEINGRLGAPKQVNVTVIVVGEADQMYLEGLRESWLGGKKNDLVVVVGAPNYPEIAWAGVMSWTKNEEVKIVIRDRLLALGTFDGDKALDIIAEEVKERFVRRPWADFEYLKATLEPPAWAQWLLFFLGLALAVGLQVYFWRNDPFGDERRGRFR